MTADVTGSLAGWLGEFWWAWAPPLSITLGIAGALGLAAAATRGGALPAIRPPTLPWGLTKREVSSDALIVVGVCLVGAGLHQAFGSAGDLVSAGLLAAALGVGVGRGGG